MTTLAETQHALQRYLLGLSCDVEPLIAIAGPLDARSRLAIYGHAYVSRLVGALAEAYPALRLALGESRFTKVAREYVAAHPSRTPSVRWYGAGLPAFLGVAATTARQQGLVELARWEWSLGLAFDAADAASVDETVLASVGPGAWADLRLHFVPSLQRVDLSTNALDWWRAATQGATRPARWRRKPPTRWVAWRHGLTTSFRSIPADEADCLDAATQGRDFGALCERLANANGEAAAPLRAATLLKGWLANGWISRLAGI